MRRMPPTLPVLPGLWVGACDDGRALSPYGGRVGTPVVNGSERSHGRHAATVDGGHPTDLGFTRMATALGDLLARTLDAR